MSIYIKGIDMPERCWDCPMCYDMMSCRLTGLNWYEDTMDWSIDPVEERMPNCPLIELPEHGDLIDRSKIVYTRDDSGLRSMDFAHRAQLENITPVIPAEEE